MTTPPSPQPSPSPQPPESTLAADLDAVRRHTTLLVEHAGALRDVRAPSLCDGWSRAHVLAHVARNAEAIQRLAQWAVDGTARPMYPGGTAGRDAAIEEGAAQAGPASPDDPRPGGLLVDDLAATADALDPHLAALAGPLAVDRVEMRGGLLVPPLALPRLRLREVVFHHVDLDDGFTFAHVEPQMLRAFVDDAATRLGAFDDQPGLRLVSDEGDEWVVGDGALTVQGDRAGLLLWLARRDPRGVTAERALPDLPRGS
ncbi:maleylpyruvate isomerase [Pedococcus dokdonensis]|uniref:Maleylpyruvate isomerase n=1 Tax=Pedococcus dokdonensis TaxID=443156 RepID=A0A1H0P8K1_9MICO|nr:maleylpyruvate isomerase family mycothiol-dependent enzyme [Pedococcus dokdonensis]SDP00966.1 maleylpyruvate isomerase [Pedococcus dokdonensis]